MSPRPLSRPRHARWAALLGMLCIVLLLLGTAAQAAHSHPDESIHSNCALCVVVHAVSAVAVSLPPAPLLEAIGPSNSLLSEVFQYCEIPFALSIRPPPGPAAIS